MSLLANQRSVLLTKRTDKVWALLPYFLGCVVFNLWGCAPQNPAQLYQSASIDPPSKAPIADDSRQSSYERLQTIVNQREHDSFTPDFAIGPGDVLKISVPDVQELKERTERVSGEGMIELPIAGSIQVGSLTESQVKDAITKALSKYIKVPQVDLFITKYSSRQVAVTGMVNKPGLYTLNSRDDTIMEMIAQRRRSLRSGRKLHHFYSFVRFRFAHISTAISCGRGRHRSGKLTTAQIWTSCGDNG